MEKSDLKREDCESDLAFSLLNPEAETKALRLEVAGIRRELAGIRELMARRTILALMEVDKDAPVLQRLENAITVLNVPITTGSEPVFSYGKDGE